jgi:asparagine synthase (glutamine-hydrolysing)
VLLRRLPASLRSGLEGLARGTRRLDGGRIVSWIENHRKSPLARLQRYNLVSYLGPQRIFTPRFLEGVIEQAPMLHLEAVWAEAGPLSNINAHLAYDWRITLADNDLPKVQQACAWAGVEAAYPLLDDRLVDFSLLLAPGQKVRGGHLRVFFKEALRDFLPKKILRKKKHGFGLPFGLWLLQHPGLNNFAREALSSLARRHVLQESFVDVLMNDLLPRHPGYFGEMVWLPVMLEYWLRTHHSPFEIG